MIHIRGLAGVGYLSGARVLAASPSLKDLARPADMLNMKTRAGERAFQIDIHSLPSWNLSVLMRQIEMEAVASLHQAAVRLASQPRDVDSNWSGVASAAR